MEEVYVVTAGSYSSYHIVGVFSNEGLAKIQKDAISDSNDIEKYTIDKIHPKLLQGYKRYIIFEMDRDGNSQDIDLDDVDNYEDKNSALCILSLGKREWDFIIWGKDKFHAVKIANEYRIQLIENNLWDTTEIMERIYFA